MRQTCGVVYKWPQLDPQQFWLSAEKFQVSKIYPYFTILGNNKRPSITTHLPLKLFPIDSVFSIHSFWQKYMEIGKTVLPSSATIYRSKFTAAPTMLFTSAWFDSVPVATGKSSPQHLITAHNDFQFWHWVDSSEEILVRYCISHTQSCNSYLDSNSISKVLLTRIEWSK